MLRHAKFEQTLPAKTSKVNLRSSNEFSTMYAEFCAAAMACLRADTYRQAKRQFDLYYPWFILR